MHTSSGNPRSPNPALAGHATAVTINNTVVVTINSSISSSISITVVVV